VALWQAPAAVAAEGVAVRLPGGAGQRFVTNEQIEQAADVPVTEYVLRAADGREERVFQTGTRLGTVLALGGLDPAAVSFLEIERPDGSVLSMPREAIDPATGASPPLVWVDGDTIGFIRPSAGRGDPNERDSFSVSGGRPLRVTARTGANLSVEASAGRMRIEAGEAVTFSGEATGGAAGERLAFEWRFGDGSIAAGPRARHVFRRAGTYPVVLRVTGDRDAGGTSEPLSIQVGEPRTAGKGPGGGTSEEEGAPESGPQEPEAGGGAQPAPAGEPSEPERDPAQRPEQDPRPRDRQGTELPADQVSGVRITRVGAPVDPAAAPTAPAARAGGGEADADENGVVPAGALVALALLAVGVWREVKES
jgi:PKD domain